MRRVRLAALLAAGLSAFAALLAGHASAVSYGVYGWPADAGPSPALPYPTVFAESQVWWGEGLSCRSPHFAHMANHVHYGLAFPWGEAIQYVNGRHVFPGVIRLHHMQHDPARAAWVRGGFIKVGNGESGRQETLNWNPAGADEMHLYTRSNAPVDPSVSGLRQARFTVNAASPHGGGRMFESTGFQALVNRPAGTFQKTGGTARGWYEGLGYTNVALTTKTRASLLAMPGGLPRTLSYSLAQGAKWADAYIDPNIHAGSKGVVLFENRTGSKGSFPMPTLPPGPHVLLLVGKEQHAKGCNAAVLRVPFQA